MESIKIYAKANLSLSILSCEHGMHELDMVVGSCEQIYDEIFFRPLDSKEIKFSCDCPLVPNENTATRMCFDFISEFSTGGGEIFLKKGIPFEGGLGGSSAAAAGVCLLMQSAYGIRNESKIVDLCKRVGSDVYYMTKGGFARLGGYGEKIESFSANPIHAIVSQADGGVNTKECFKLFDKSPDTIKVYTERLINAVKKSDIKEIKKYMKNHLQESAIKINGQIAEIISASGGVMSGSGSCVVSIYDTKEQALEAQKTLPNSRYTLIF